MSVICGLLPVASGDQSLLFDHRNASPDSVACRGTKALLVAGILDAAEQLSESRLWPGQIELFNLGGDQLIKLGGDATSAFRKTAVSLKQ